MICGKLLNGRLTDIQNVCVLRTWTDGSTDVQLVSMPNIPGPYAYDSVKKVATAAPKTVQEKLGLIPLCLAMMASPTTWATLTAAEKTEVQTMINQWAVVALAALRGN